MLTLKFYTWLHVLGVMLLLAAFGGAILREVPASRADDRMRGRISMLHGIGLLLILVAGFGMAARLEIFSVFPAWMIAKLVLWLFLGGWLVVAYKRRLSRLVLLGVAIGASALSAWIGIMKPF